MTAVLSNSKLFTFIPAQWRMIHYLRQGRIARWSGSPNSGNNVSTHYHDARRLIDRQGAQYGDLQMLQHYGYLQATVGLGGPAVDLVKLSRLPKTGRPAAQVKVALTREGQGLARDPMHLVLQAAARRVCYQVKDVTSSAGLGRADVKPVLLTLEDARLIECSNDTGNVPMTMWSGDIPPNLRLRTTRKGATYLARKA